MKLDVIEFKKRLVGFQPARPLDWEYFLARLLFAGVLFRFADVDDWFSFHGTPKPNGPAALLHATLLSDHPGLVNAVMWTAMLAYVAGFLLPLATATLAVICILGGSLKNSQGAINHSDQVLSLLLCAQLVAFAWTALRRPDDAARSRNNLALSLSAQVVASIYVSSAITKLRTSGLGWIENSANISVEVMKTHGQNYCNQLEAGVLERGQAWVDRILDNPAVTQLTLGSGLFLELFAFLALLGRRWGLVIGMSLVLLHAGVKTLMGLDFRTNQVCILIFSCGLPYWLLLGAEKLRERASRAS